MEVKPAKNNCFDNQDGHRVYLDFAGDIEAIKLFAWRIAETIVNVEFIPENEKKSSKINNSESNDL